jgi:type I restriction enzyme S subunit
MSHIEDLIKELAPDGVPIQPLGEVGTFTRGRRFTKDDRVDNGLPSIHYGEIYTHYGVAASDAISTVRSDLAPTLRFAQPGDVIIAAVGETVEDVGKAVAWLGTELVAVHDDCFIFRSSLNPKFVAYFMQSEAFNKPKEAYVARAKVKRLSSAGLAKLRIPVPPVEVQQEIVRVLDHFSVLAADLATQLGAELQARQKQREFVVSQVIAGIDARHETLRNLGNWRGGMTPSKSEPRYWESGTIPWLASMDVSESEGRAIRGRVTPVALAETSLRVVPTPSVVVVMRSNILRRRLPVGMTTVETTLNQDVKALTPRDGIDPEYVYQVLRATSEQIRAACVRADGSMAAVDSKAFFDWSIPIPPFQDQNRIATRLSAFEAVVSELSISLPAERGARRKQYEYYRDRLLTFKELVA